MITIRLLPENSREAVFAVGVSIIGCTLGVLVIDAAFRSSLTSQYVSTFTGPHQGLKTLLMISNATRDELLGRLVLVGGMTAIVGLVMRGRKMGLVTLAAIFIAAQVAILLPQLVTPANATELVYDVLRYISPGILWGWLFWRHGFIAALLGHTGTHPILDPALHALLSQAQR
jgi:hypothetical protein